LGRIVGAAARVALVGWRLQGDLYHFHDPELICYGLILRLFGKRVIYDAHEDVPRDILSKEWIPRILRHPVSWAMAIIEWMAGHTLSGVVAATPTIAARFPARRVALVQNYASFEEFGASHPPRDGHRCEAVYVGSITRERCAVEMVDAIARIERFPEARLVIAGPVNPPDLMDRLATSPGWPRVDYRGRQSRVQIHQILTKARIGLALFHPVRSYVESQPVKIFEYFAAGLPVIAADFPSFREIVEKNGCGICVPPRDSAAIAAAIEWMLEHPTEAKRMGACGRELFLKAYNWEREADTLLRFYQHILAAR
jgi:glycosyltransferase involved in cell wall biosynthesis